MTKEDNEHFESSKKSWICNNSFVEGDIKVRDHFHVTGNYRCAATRDCNINVGINYKIPIVFTNQKKINACLIMQELHKFGPKVNVIRTRLEKYMSLSLESKLVFIESFQFLSSS